MNTEAPDDALLSAYLDGELTADERRSVEAWLREHPESVAMLRTWSADMHAMRAALDGAADEPVPPALAQTVWRKGPAGIGAFGWSRWATAASAMAVFVLGGLIGAAAMWRLQPRDAGSGADYAALSGAGASSGAGWVRRAAVAHSVYVPEVRHPVEVAAQEEHLSRWLTRRLDVPVKLFDLRAQGYELVGGRLLPDASGPSAQLMYQAIDDGGGAAASGATGVTGAAAAKPQRVTVYLRKPDDATPAAFRYERQGELGLFYWVEGKSAHGGPTGYAIVGALPREKLLALAEAIYRQQP